MLALSLPLLKRAAARKDLVGFWCVSNALKAVVVTFADPDKRELYFLAIKVKVFWAKSSYEYVSFQLPACLQWYWNTLALYWLAKQH